MACAMRPYAKITPHICRRVWYNGCMKNKTRQMAGMGLMLAAMFAAQMDAAHAAIGRIADLIARFHPVMSALLSATGAALLRGALGVTGTALLIGACLAPAARLTAAILGCRLAAALAEPAADGPLVKCLCGFADAMQILLVAMAACASLFLVIAGAGVAAGAPETVTYSC